MPSQYTRNNSINSNVSTISDKGLNTNKAIGNKSPMGSKTQILGSFRENKSLKVNQDPQDEEMESNKDLKQWKFASATLSTFTKATKQLSNVVLNKLEDWTRSIAEAFLVPDENHLTRSSQNSSTEDIDSDSDGSSTYGARSSSTVSTTPTQTPTQSQSRRFSKDTTSQQSSSYTCDQYYILPDIDPNATMVPLFSGWTAYRGAFVSAPLVSNTHWDDLVKKRKEETLERIKKADLEEESREEVVLHDSPTESTEQRTVSLSDNISKKTGSWLVVGDETIL